MNVKMIYLVSSNVNKFYRLAIVVKVAVSGLYSRQVEITDLRDKKHSIPI